MITIPKLRGFLYLLAKLLGDYRAIKTGRIGRRIARRLAGKATGRGLGRLFPSLAVVAVLAACSATADAGPLTFGEYLEIAAAKYDGAVELIEPEILDLPIVTFENLEPRLCVNAAEAHAGILAALGVHPIARATFEDGTILALEADTDDPNAIVVYVFGIDDGSACMLAIGVTGPLP